MSQYEKEINRRRTFAIISHPDAGKTTLTEKLLLYGGAINQAGSVKGKQSAKHAVSDWMDIEKQRGISVTSSVLQFNYAGKCVNILDTPGHQDFSEDTYRTLMAADSAVMVIDAAKGVEAQTIKLFKVCTLRHIPIFTFINKMDREARDSFELLEELEKAERYIFLEYFILQEGECWNAILDILERKAAAGVEVRVFYDDMGSIGFVDTAFAKKLQQRGIQCRVFNPIVPVLNVFMNNRDHRKITVIDGQVGYTGGYNLADEYFNLTHPYGRWKDSGVRLEGDAVRNLTLIFLEMWGTTQKEMPAIEPYLPAIRYTAREAATVLPYADNPLDDKRVGEDVYLNFINSAQRYVYITTPYLILSDEMQRALVLAAQRGVDVRIITPGIPDKKLIFSVTRSYYARLAAGGVQIYEYTPGFIHAKQFVADDKAAAVGTINLDYRSLYLHFENGCWFCGCQAVQDVRADFEALFPQCENVTPQYSGQRSLALRGVQCVFRLFSPLM